VIPYGKRHPVVLRWISIKNLSLLNCCFLQKLESCHNTEFRPIMQLLTRSQAVVRIADRTAKKLQGSRDVGHAHFQGKLFVRPLGIPERKLHTKFEVSSSSSFRFEILRSKRNGVTSLTFKVT